MPRSRQLVAIMFTDIEGYTALMQQNEEKAIQVRNKHRRIFNSITEKHSGRILQYYGDGTLSIFDSAIAAVQCGIELQEGFQKEPAIPVRIGIHSGDILYSDEEIIGDGVNVTSRIESLAVPGSVFISEKVYDEIKNQASILTSRMKAFKFKNIEKPIEVYAIANEGLVVPNPKELKGKTEPTDTPDIPERSIAVLAFENMSGDPEQEYFSDGLSEEILNALTHVEELKVAGRTSAFSFKGKNEDIRKIGDQLGVKMVLEGSVRKAGNQVRITTQLINVEDGFHIWSEAYDKELEDIFSVQEDIAKRIVEKLKLQLQNTFESRTQNVEAYELLLKGAYFFKRDFEGKKKAMAYFKQVIALDPEYALAYAFIGETYLYYASSNVMLTADGYAKSRAAAQKAISLNKYESRAHKVLAYIHLFYDWDWEATRSEYKKSIQYGRLPQNEFITYYYIFLNKDFEGAIRISQQILETEPLDMTSHCQLGICYYFAGRLEEALVAFNNALELDPNYSDAHQWKGVVLAYLGKFEAAVSALEKALEISQDEDLIRLDLLVVKIQMGEKEEALQSIKSVDFIDPMDAAMLYTLLGRPDDAIFWLEKGYRERSVMMVTLKHYWIWDPIRDDVRFMEIYQRMNFPE